MYTGSDSSVQSGLLTGKAWDRTCHWISDYKITVNNVEETISLTDSRKYGNYKNAVAPATTGTYTSNQKQLSGANDNWKIKNIYDLAGNVWEWTYESTNSRPVHHGGSYWDNGDEFPVSYRSNGDTAGAGGRIGFRVRLYIKTN